jgi:uncharacterized membrane protein
MPKRLKYAVLHLTISTCISLFFERYTNTAVLSLVILQKPTIMILAWNLFGQIYWSHL